MTERSSLVFNPPPGWPKPPKGWSPPPSWKPDPAWPTPPLGWELWIPAGSDSALEGAGDAGKRINEERGSLTTPNIASDHRLALLEAENRALRAGLDSRGFEPDQVVLLDDERVLQEAGVYRYHHPLENAVAYRDRLRALSDRIAIEVKAGTAIEKSNEFTFDGSLAKGRAMASDLAKLMLRAYNAEAENVIRAMRFGNAISAVKRLEAAREAIARLGKMMQMRISDTYHRLRVEEIELTSDFLAKKEEEKEAARAERERLREERKVEQELAAAREKLEKERTHLLTVIEKVQAAGGGDPELERKLADIDEAIKQNDYRAANIRAGYVYVISNRGALGEDVVKIGLTRRLEPLDRINELGDASVPFKYDVHAIFFSEDAVSLEAQLHEHFSHSRVNWVNDRKEFFFARPGDVRGVLAEKLGNLLEFQERVESEEFLQSVKYWPRGVVRARSLPPGDQALPGETSSI
jgi:hypothetical protein